LPKFDIWPFDSRGVGPVPFTAGMTASEAFNAGEVVVVVDAGTVTVAPEDTTQLLIADLDSGMQGGIACYGPGDSTLNPKTGAAWASNDEVAFWPWDEGTLFITDNFLAAGAGALETGGPLLTDIGESYQISYATAGTPDIGWGVEKTAGVVATDVCAVIRDVLDANKRPIRDSGQTGVYVVFTIHTSI
jgi:hypothetical protein